MLGCVVGLKTSVTGITIIALGTSLPDTFASRTAAIQDEYADAAIGNVTGTQKHDSSFLNLNLYMDRLVLHSVKLCMFSKCKINLSSLKELIVLHVLV